MTKSVLVHFATDRNYVGGLDIFGADFFDKDHPEKYFTGSVQVYQTGIAWSLDYGSLVYHPPAAVAAAASEKQPSGPLVVFAREQAAIEARRTVTSSKAASYGLIFLHGFNTKFVKAIEESAQIAASYNADSVFCFSWPSIGAGVSAGSYNSDHASATKAAPAIADALLGLLVHLNSLKAAERPTLNIVAHSMGNHALSGAVQIIHQNQPAQIQKDLFDGALLMAADEAQDALSKADLLAPLVTLAKRVTSYYSGHDLVLALSQLYNGRTPLGLVKPTGLASLDAKVTAVDCSDVASTQDESGHSEYGHGYFRGSVWVINDVRQVLANTAPVSINGRLPDMVDPADGHAWWIPYDTGAGRLPEGRN